MRTRTALAVAFTALVALAPLAVAPARAAQVATAADALTAEAVAAAPKVVIVVGATESTTASYRTMADSIAAEAIKWTPNVVKVYSPNATWAVVRAAAQGASIFVYLGHGNGFPSPYGTTLNPTTEDGMGLNTTLGLGDSDKKYYGESVVASGIRFADNAVVFLNHLCYAPGAGEPGAPEPTISVAEQRVDNFASGFIRAGARMVVADDYTTSVQGSIRAIFTSHQSMLSMWRTLSGYHGNEIPFTPTRNPSFRAVLDPETWTSGFTRSIVTDPGFTTDDVLAGAGHPATGTPTTLTAPGAASVVTAGLPLDTDQDLLTPAGSTFAVGTKLRVDAVVPGTPGTDGTTPPPAVQVHTLDGALNGWVSGAGLAPGDAASPELWALTGGTTVSPNFDGSADRLDLWGRLSEAAPWTWTLRDADSNVVRTQSGSTDLFALSWDALPGGHPAPAGTYHWTLHADDGWGNPPLDESGDVTVVDVPIPATAVLNIKSLGGTYTSAATLAFQITFASSVTGLAAGDFIRSGTATSCIVGQPTGGPGTWVVPVSQCSEGTVALTLKARSVIDETLATGPATAVVGPNVKIDRTKPTTTAPRTGFKTAVVMSGVSMPVIVTWTAADGGSGLASYDVARSVDGGAFSVIQTGAATSLVQSVLGSHTYRYEVRAHDKAGNVGPWAAGPTLQPSLVQETGSTVGWAGAWTTKANLAYSGGSLRSAAAAGATVAFTFTGRTVAIIGSRDPANGQVKVYLDGVLVATVDTVASGHIDRAVLYNRTVTWGSHKLRLVVAGTAGRPTVAIDAFEVLR
jgi:hypothetical protein